MKEAKIRLDSVNFYYQEKLVLRGLEGELEENAISTVIGPSGVGKSTFLMILP
ncbi:MAG: hypothetical protein JRI41_09350 [Deltaproteobacteria bacterium]|nr:hypothetical protein [Deltaproteobacteria bacterium]